MAMERGNNDIIALLLQEETHPSEKRTETTRSMMNIIMTGSYNYRSLGVPVIRQLMQSRGSREGNNALLKVRKEAR